MDEDSHGSNAQTATLLSKNLAAGICSLFVPGLGQLVQGRLLAALIQFLLAALLWFVVLGWAVHVWSVVDALFYDPSAQE